MNKEQYSIMYRIEDTHWWYVGMRAITFSLLKATQRDLQESPSNYPEGNRALVLDAGCGTGGTLAHLPNGARGVGIDYSADAIDLSCQRGLNLLSQASVEHLPFPDNTFSLVLCSDVIYHLGVQHDLQALEETLRVLRPGGMAVIRVAAYNWLRGAHDQAVHTRHRYTRREIQLKMAAAGFHVERVTYANSILFPLALAKRALEGKVTEASSELENAGTIEQWAGRAALTLEARLVSRFNLPFGLSVIGVGRKPRPTGPESPAPQPPPSP